MTLLERSREEQQMLLLEVQEKLKQASSKNLQLNMARGNPSLQQINMVSDLFEELTLETYNNKEGMDVRNYGGLYGILEMRELFSDLLKCSEEEVWCISSSSLTIEYDILSRLRLFPLPGQNTPWPGENQVKFLCPVPGYDRHYNMLQQLGYEMIPIPMHKAGPDMEQVKALCKNDPSIKGIWIVPLYSNPTGTSYSEEVLYDLLEMDAAPDFRIFADMAYVVHHLYEKEEEQDPVYPLLPMAREAKNPDRIFLFASTSKMTFPGAGVACLATSAANQSWLLPSLSAQMISSDKFIMWKHYHVFKQLGGVQKLMARHANLLRPKFELVLNTLEEHLGPLGIATWTKPRGGYFITVTVYPHTATATYNRCKELGVSLTHASACFPYGNNPEDNSMRIAPSYPSLDALAQAIEIYCLVQTEQALLRIIEEQR